MQGIKLIAGIGRVSVAAVLLVAPWAAAAERYTVVMSGLPKGELVVRQRDERTRHTTYSFRDRGRGPDLESVVRVDEAGIPMSVEVTGVDYRRMPVAETFKASAGDTNDDRPARYRFPDTSNSEDLAILARALLQAPEHRLGLAPAGEARIEKALDREVAGDGGQVTASLYFIHGMGLQPVPVWLDAKQRLFAAGGVWLGVIRAGYEEAQAGLLSAQEEALADAARARADDARQVPDGAVLIRGAKLFDAEARRLLSGMSVLIEGDRIVDVAPDGQVRPPYGGRVIEAEGQALLPGLWDMHVHLLSHADGLMTMLTGITTVRDMGNDVETLKGLTEQFDSGRLVGPHVLKAGLVDGKGEFSGPTKMLVDTPDEMRAAVNTYADLGYGMIKLYSSLDPELVEVGADAAHARGLQVGGHVPAGMTVREAVDAGLDEIQHGNYWLLNLLGPEVIARTHTPARFTDAYEQGHTIDPDGRAVGEFIAHLKASGAAVDPTLVTFETMFTGREGELARWMAPWSDRLPARSLEGGRGGGRAGTAAERRQYRESWRRMLQILKRLHEAGVPILVGTDGSGLLYARELELHVEAGLPPADVLYNATLGAAREMGLAAEVGDIAVGKRADLVLVDGNPLEDIGVVRRATLVVKGGVLHDVEALAAAAGLMPVIPHPE